MATTPVYQPTQGMQQRGMYDNGKNYVRNFVVANPMMMAVSLGAVTVVTLFLAYYAYSLNSQLNACRAKGTFITQYPMTGLHSNWHLGGGDAGWGGSLHRETTPAQAAAYHPAYRGAGHEKGVCNATDGTRENMTSSPNACASNCGGCCKSLNCGGCWDKGAIVEARAAAHLGSLPHESNADAPLTATVSGAFDCVSSPCVGLDDQALSDLMHNGGAP